MGITMTETHLSKHLDKMDNIENGQKFLGSVGSSFLKTRQTLINF